MTDIVDNEPETLPVVAFEVVGVRPQAWSAAPSLVFTLAATEPTGREVMTIALGAQIMLEPAKRKYAGAEREKLEDLFGPPERWSATTKPTLWGRVDMLVPSFRSATTFELRLPVTYDLEIAASRYLRALEDGEAPIAIHFSGTVMFRLEDGRMQVEQIPWTTTTDYRLPVAVWDELIERSYPGGGWIVLHEETIDRLVAERVKRGTPTFDATLLALLEDAADG